MKLPLSIAFAENPRTRPILDGRVQAEGIDWTPSVVGPSELFWRQLRYADFDVAEMSFSSFIIAMSKGDDRFLALPIFTTRRFFHAHILVRKDSGIEKPEDMKGKRVGVTEYQQTGALWTRGALEHEWGVRLRSTSGRHCEPDSRGEKCRIDDAIRRTRRRHSLSWACEHGQSLACEPC